MARTIESPGVQINEVDLSFNTSLPVGTNVLINGFAAQGPTLELVNVTSKSELEQIYGLPTTEAERYLYNSCAEILNSPANLIVNRLPYGGGTGAGFGDKYTGLFFPVSGYSSVEVAGGSLSAFHDVASSVSFGGIDLATLTNPELLVSAIPNITTVTDIKAYGFSIQLSSTAAIATFGISYNLGNGVYQLTSNYKPYDPEYFDGQINTKTGDFSISIPGLTTGTANITASYVQTQLLSTYTSGYVPANYASSHQFKIGQPKLLSLTEDEYMDIKSGQINWSINGYNPALTASNVNPGYCGFIVVNKSKVSTDDIAQGYYISVIDSFSANVSGSPQYDSISAVKTVNKIYPLGYYNLSPDALGVSLTGTDTENVNSISEMMESGYQYDFTQPAYQDSIILSLFRLRTSNTAQDENKVYVGYTEKYVGSLDKNDARNNPRTLTKESFFIEKSVNTNSGFIELYINPNISEKAPWTESSQANNGRQGRVGTVQVNGEAKNAYSLGQYVSTRGVNQSKIIGEVPAKLEKALMIAENKDVVDVDLVVEAGLGTVYSYAKIADPVSPTDYDPAMSIQDSIDALADTTNGMSSSIATYYKVIQNQLQNFVSETRKDCLLISDPLRGILVQGKDMKMIQRKDKNFSQHIYWPLKNLYGASNSNYVAAYGNWVKAFDTNSGDFVWMPFSGFQAAIIARMDANTQPWFAPAGLENGIVRNVVDIAINPTQKQRDLLYKIGINPVVYFPRDAYTVWGQKTLQAKPSAFDRINVRRLFLVLEKATLRLTRYFVMQPNTVFTRTRLVNYLKPIFDIAKQNEGVYDYLLVCDERNNTPDVIDRNELVLDIYIKPVRTAEFILVNFIATRTGADFNELIR